LEAAPELWNQTREIILLVGKSGSGKNHIIRSLGLKPVVTYTTRPMRPGEQQGVEHHFVNAIEYPEQRIQTIQNSPDTLGFTRFNGNNYWFTVHDIDGDVVTVDPDGIRFFRSKGPRLAYRIVYLDCPWYRRMWRMHKRGDSWRNIVSRLRHDRDAFRGVRKYAEYIINV